MRLSADCMTCLASKQAENTKTMGDEEARTEYMSRVMKLIAQAPRDEASPPLFDTISREYSRFWNISMNYDREKNRYNDLLLEKEEELSRLVEASPQPLELALKLARAGNYIDFGTHVTVTEETLDRILKESLDEPLQQEPVRRLTDELPRAASMVYLTDNCGEIVLDKLAVRALRRLYPHLDITVVTRSLPVLNDATVEDACAVGMDKLARVVGNGTGIPGTQLGKIAPEAEALIRGADLIFAKGQGNFETLGGCGLNIYYLFLCKCEYFERRFQLPRLKGAFFRERDHAPSYWGAL